MSINNINELTEIANTIRGLSMDAIEAQLGIWITIRLCRNMCIFICEPNGS